MLVVKPTTAVLGNCCMSKSTKASLCFRLSFGQYCCVIAVASNYSSFFSNDSAGAFTITDSTKVQMLVTINTNNDE